MDNVYILIAKRDPALPDAITVKYESMEYALAAAKILREHCATVTLFAPDGSLIQDNRSKV